ncbi:MAG TPA: Ig-like domain-containing protein [Verrucomicrobiae bacterium]|nr:Ig-like domain-containing protein [Verrucomicrobiae bacterium]
MKITIKVAVLGMIIMLAQPLPAQTNLNFNGVSTTGEGAIRLSWNSRSNEVYRIDYADELGDTNTGMTVWHPLYTHYPSHGTNTFIGDYGNYDNETNIVHPKYSPMRFYRIAIEGTNDGPSPFITILSPTNGSVLSDQVTISVVATSTFPVINLKLYVDGQEMDRSEDGTNFVINTCEWANGPHVFFCNV